MADFIFDGPNRLIKEPQGSGNTLFDVDRDMYSAWKRWVQSGQGSQYLNAFLIEGGTPIGSTGFFTGVTLILTNGWKVRGADHDHQLFLDGNLFSDDGVVSSPNPNFNVEVFVNSSTTAQGISTGSGLSSDQQAMLMELWRMRGLDTANPVTVTQTEEIAGDIELDITGDGVNTNTLTRRS